MFITDLIISDKEKFALEDLFLNQSDRSIIELLIKEHTYFEELNKFGLPVNNKIILHGSSGCGKTTTAKAISGALNKKLMVLNLSNVICSRVGETAQNMKMVFDRAAKDNAVLFLDEFDQIGKLRSIDDKDTGEMRRLINTLIQLIDYFPKDSVLICATNHRSFIDPALLRRFQLQISFVLPDDSVLDKYYDKLLSAFPEKICTINRKYGISFAEAKDFVFTTIKSNLMKDLDLQAQVKMN